MFILAELGQTCGVKDDCVSINASCINRTCVCDTGFNDSNGLTTTGGTCLTSMYYVSELHDNQLIKYIKQQINQTKTQQQPKRGISTKQNKTKI